MPIIEGIGDEVVQFACAVLLITISTLAWRSTNARPDRYRSVVVMRSQTQHPVSVSIRTGGEPSMFSTSARIGRATVHHRTVQASTAAAAVSLTPAPATTTPNEYRSVIPFQEMDSIIDADVALFNNSRMHFYRRVENQTNINALPQRDESSDSEVEEIAAIEPASTEQMREMDNIVNAMRGDVNAPCFTQPSDDNNSNPAAPVISNVDASDKPVAPEEANRKKILIKLKYLNETQKEVEGNLDELLKDFKWRHFSQELTEQSAVRLIYQGRVLEEARTLGACGLRDQAVVHALVHPRRAPSQAHNTADDTIGTPLEIIHERAQAERAWDLENILMTLVSVALTVVWFFRFLNLSTDAVFLPMMYRYYQQYMAIDNTYDFLELPSENLDLPKSAVRRRRNRERNKFRVSLLRVKYLLERRSSKPRHRVGYKRKYPTLRYRKTAILSRDTPPPKYFRLYR